MLKNEHVKSTLSSIYLQWTVKTKASFVFIQGHDVERMTIKCPWNHKKKKQLRYRFLTYRTDISRVGLVGTFLTCTSLSWFAPGKMNSYHRDLLVLNILIIMIDYHHHRCFLFHFSLDTNYKLLILLIFIYLLRCYC